MPRPLTSGPVPGLRNIAFSRRFARFAQNCIGLSTLARLHHLGETRVALACSSETSCDGNSSLASTDPMTALQPSQRARPANQIVDLAPSGRPRFDVSGRHVLYKHSRGVGNISIAPSRALFCRSELTRRRIGQRHALARP